MVLLLFGLSISKIELLPFMRFSPFSRLSLQ
ncbi:hypothetical protein F383_01294 [Gossypium arboreum]|uniref:Uncharacterized protein n=1 Tax=Gossypium arboreum TaxID=29729 RepID=A0A0B0Q0J9_GOSAR|nr:hypothetical protein F383_01294 [Gossypium arboreum]